MCLSTQAIVVFLNLLNPEIISTENSRITIDAETQTAVWVQAGDTWCTDAPGQYKFADAG